MKAKITCWRESDGKYLGYLVTTDDGLLKKSKRHSSQLKVSVLNPIDIVSLP